MLASIAEREQFRSLLAAKLQKSLRITSGWCVKSDGRRAKVLHFDSRASSPTRNSTARGGEGLERKEGGHPLAVAFGAALH